MFTLLRCVKKLSAQLTINKKGGKKKQKQNLRKFTAVTFVCSDTLEAINHAYN